MSTHNKTIIEEGIVLKKFKLITVIVLTLMLVLPTMAYGQQPQVVTRIQFVTELLKTLGTEIPTTITSPFTDVSAPEEIPYASVAHNLKIASGSSGQFRPNAPITKEEAIIMIVRALGFTEGKIDPQQSFSFADQNQIAPWAKPYIVNGIKLGLIENSTNELRPKENLTGDEMTLLFNQLKASQLREGLTPTKMLQLTEENLKSYSTYQFKGTMSMLIEAPSFTGEPEVVNSEIIMEGIFEAPETMYTETTTRTFVGGETLEQASEMFMKDRVIHTRLGKDQEWTTIDVNPLMGQLESLLGTGQQGTPQLSQEYLDIFGMYAQYSDDIEIEGEKYYVIKVELNQEAFRDIYAQILDETINFMLEGEMWEQMKQEQGLPADMDEEFFKMMMKSSIEQVLNSMKVDMTQTYYINQQTKMYEFLELIQRMEISLMGMESNMVLDGQYEYFGFGEPVTFPQILE